MNELEIIAFLRVIYEFLCSSMMHLFRCYVYLINLFISIKNMLYQVYRYQTHRYYLMSYLANCKVVLIRHGRSIYNIKCEQFTHGRKIDWSLVIQDDQFCEKTAYNHFDMDSGLAPQGYQQASKLSKILQDHPFDLVLVSPMLRALQTCNTIFKNRNIPVKVQPLLTEAGRYSCDLIPHGKTRQKHQLFPKYDFSEDYEPQFFYHFSADKLDFMKKYFKKNNIFDHDLQCKQIIKLIRYHKMIESDEQLRQRCMKMKEKVRRIIQQGNLKNICLVSHYFTIGCLLSKKFGPKGQILEWPDIQNCEALEQQADIFCKF